MLKKLFLRSFLGIVMVNFSQIQPMGLKDFVTSKSIKIFCTTAGLLGGSLLCSITAKYEMKRNELTFEKKTYNQIITEKAKIALRRFVTVSIPVSLLMVTCARSNSLPQLEAKDLVLPISIAIIVSSYNAINDGIRKAQNYPGGLDKKAKIFESITIFPYYLHRNLACAAITCYFFRHFWE